MYNPTNSTFEFLSWPLSNESPAYGGKATVSINADKSLAQGDSANTLNIALSNHSGTHVDAPLHFLKGGKSIDTYSASQFIFSNIHVMELSLNEGRLLVDKDFSGEVDATTEVLLIKTTFCQRRGEKAYIFDGPGLGEKAAKTICKRYPNLKVLGVDFISLNRWTEREMGRRAHVVLLSHNNLLIVEDMDLRNVNQQRKINSLILAPLRIEKGDGAPVTVIACY